jgi:Stage II sporulation protein E (SpoIIE)
MDRFRSLLTLLACVVLSAAAHAQIQPVQKMTHVTLGQSLVPLNGPWKFTVGDSPLDPVTHGALWAQPGFDDSHWETIDLTPTGIHDPEGGFSGYVTGWTARGHPSYSGYAWYRIRVQVTAQPGERLALAGPSYVDNGYELYSDGSLIGSFGEFTGSQPTIYAPQPMMFSLSPPAADSPVRVLAFRVWMAPFTLVTGTDTGGLHTAPALGDADAVTAEYQLYRLEALRANAVPTVEALLFVILAAIAFSLTRFDRSDPVYLWMGFVFLLYVAVCTLILLALLTKTISEIATSVVYDILNPLVLGTWVMVWWVWFQLKRPAWLPRAVVLLTVGFMVSTIIGESLLYPWISLPVADVFRAVSIAVRLALVILLILVVVWGIRRHDAEGWLVLPAVVLLFGSLFSDELILLRIRIIWYPFGVRVNLDEIGHTLLTAVLFVLLLRRLLLSVRRQRLMALDVKQAQEVQRVILPETVTTLPGLIIENEYRPAREVGGDFNQIIPNSADGSLLIVAGDVAGKGLRAGMLVALLVGAIRMAAEANSDPLFILQALNRRLLGRSEAHATCLAMRIARDGAVILANAGHLPPYLNGKPVEMEGALPLGVIDGAEFTVTHFQLQENDRLMLASDGIVEAMDKQGRLFGFERVQQLLERQVTAAEVATAAQDFGQSDDISVIAVTRTVALVPA